MFFNAEEMWSQNNGTNANGTFKGTGIYMNSVEEQFSLGNSIWFENETGHLGNLSIDGTLEMGTLGEITNTAGDYTIDENGLFLDAGEHYSIDTAIRWNNNYVDMGLYGRTGAGGDFFRVGAEVVELGLPDDNALDVAVSVDTRSGFEVITTNIPFRLPRYTDSTRPSNPETGTLIYNTDAGNVQMADNNGNWQGLA